MGVYMCFIIGVCLCVSIWVFICAPKWGYLYILTLFFYKCVWLKSQTNKYIKKYKINMKKNKINIK